MKSHPDYLSNYMTASPLLSTRGAPRRTVRDARRAEVILCLLLLLLIIVLLFLLLLLFHSHILFYHQARDTVAPAASSSPTALPRTRSKQAEVMSAGGLNCSICKSKFKNKSSLNRHERKFHKGRRSNDLID